MNNETDLFGEVPQQQAKPKGTQPNGYAAPPGSGPQGQTCRQCEHYIIRYTDAGYTHPKCGLRRATWTNGRGSDIRVSSPACSRFEPEIKDEISPELLKLPALSIRQPWAWLIVQGHKPIENRDWRTRFRGRFLVHASKGCTKEEYEDCQWFARSLGVKLPPLIDLERGGIVGVAEITDCVDKHESRWFFGKFGFVIANAKPLPFYPYKGRLGFFHLEAA